MRKIDELHLAVTANLGLIHEVIIINGPESKSNAGNHKLIIDIDAIPPRHAMIISHQSLVVSHP